jgi:hypothetical protein
MSGFWCITDAKSRLSWCGCVRLVGWTIESVKSHARTNGECPSGLYRFHSIRVLAVGTFLSLEYSAETRPYLSIYLSIYLSGSSS